MVWIMNILCSRRCLSITGTSTFCKAEERKRHKVVSSLNQTIIVLSISYLTGNCTMFIECNELWPTAVKHYNFVTNFCVKEYIHICTSNAFPTKAYRNFWTDVNGQMTKALSSSCVPLITSQQINSAPNKRMLLYGIFSALTYLFSIQENNSIHRVIEG